MELNPRLAEGQKILNSEIGKSLEVGGPKIAESQSHKGMSAETGPTLAPKTAFHNSTIGHFSFKLLPAACNSQSAEQRTGLQGKAPQFLSRREQGMEGGSYHNPWCGACSC